MRTLKFSFILIVLVLCFWSLVMELGSPIASLNSEFKRSDSNGSSESAARELYRRNCARCHGADGKGETKAGAVYDVPNIADANWQKRHSDKKIAAKIIKGGGGMPAFGKKLSKDEIASLVAYVRSLKK